MGINWETEIYFFSIVANLELKIRLNKSWGSSSSPIPIILISLKKLHTISIGISYWSWIFLTVAIIWIDFSLRLLLQQLRRIISKSVNVRLIFLANLINRFTRSNQSSGIDLLLPFHWSVSSLFSNLSSLFSTFSIDLWGDRDL